MEHFNPILGHETTGPKFITCGEIMLRLTPPNYEKLRMATNFEASYGGSEANIALALANLGVDSTFFSVVPNNSLGKSAVRWLRSNDVHCTPMILTEPDETPSNRLGTYYLETGYGIRPSKVIYDRKHSAITEYDFSQVDLDELLEGFDWLHLSGITPALAPNCRGLIIDMLKEAKKKGLTVSFDGNFRSTLWTWDEARDFCTECLPYVDVLLGIEPYHLWKDENDHSKGDWKDGVPLQPSYEQQDEIFQHFIERYPSLKCIARHVRYAHSGSENSLKAFMWYDGHTFESKLFTFNILDRVGGGDAFASGLIYAMLHNYKAQRHQAHHPRRCQHHRRCQLHPQPHEHELRHQALKASQNGPGTSRLRTGAVLFMLCRAGTSCRITISMTPERFFELFPVKSLTNRFLHDKITDDFERRSVSKSFESNLTRTAPRGLGASENSGTP